MKTMATRLYLLPGLDWQKSNMGPHKARVSGAIPELQSALDAHGREYHVVCKAPARRVPAVAAEANAIGRFDRLPIAEAPVTSMFRTRRASRKPRRLSSPPMATT